MTIERDGKLYTLTEQELKDAYEEQRVRNDLEEINGYLEMFNDDPEEFGLMKDDRCAKEVAKIYRRWLNSYIESIEGNNVCAIAHDIFIDAYDRVLKNFIDK